MRAMKIHMVLSILTAVFHFSAYQAYAEGGQDGGGGVGFYCNEGGEMKAYLADTYDLIKSGQLGRLKKFREPNFEEVIRVIDQYHSQKVFQHPFVLGEKVTLGFMIAHANNGLKYIRTNSPIPPSNDDHIPSQAIPQHCTKIQLARQYFATNVVLYSSVNLSTEEHLYLFLHEALISIRNRPGSDTTEIRKKVSDLGAILSNPRSFSIEVLKQMTEKRSIVSQENQTRFRTLYYFPQRLVCETTWIGPHNKFLSTPITHPSRIVINRTKGDGRVGEHNVFSVTTTVPKLRIFRKSITLSNVESDFHTESYNAFGEPDGIGTFHFSMAFNPQGSVEIPLSINHYDSVTGEYLGEYDIDDTEQMKVVAEHSDFGLRCWPSEKPIFQKDERSKVYAPSCVVKPEPGCR